MSDDKKLNPEIKEIEYGKKEIKKLTLYPLSVGDQFTITDIINKIFMGFAEVQSKGKMTEVTSIGLVLEAIKENIYKIIMLVADVSEDKAKEIISNLTNSQLLDIVEIIWEVNFEPAIKKGRTLFEKGKSMFNSERLSPSSSNFTPNTDLKVSTDKPIDKGE